jgi:hypothetical protein
MCPMSSGEKKMNIRRELLNREENKKRKLAK